MRYDNIVEGIFIKRINRFIALAEIGGVIQEVHVKNTGRCKELFIEGKKIYLQKSDNLQRKTKYSLISIYKGDKLINIDSQIPNYVVFEGILQNKIPEFQNIDIIKKEKVYKNSRFDIYYRKVCGTEGFIEIKGVTLENDGKTMFPDAPTERGRKHIHEMIDAVKNGYEGTMFFLIQMENAYEFKSNSYMDKKFSEALTLAGRSGVNVLAYNSKVTKNAIEINHRVKLCNYKSC